MRRGDKKEIGPAVHTTEVVHLGVGGGGEILPWVSNHLVLALQFKPILDLQGMGPAYVILPIG